MIVSHDQELADKFRNYRNDMSKCSQLDQDSTKLFALATIIEMNKDKLGDAETEYFTNHPSFQIIQKRIEVYELNIKFSITGVIAAMALTRGVPGRCVTLLIDLLNTLPQGHEVTARDLAYLYPHGFYNEETFGEYIDTVLKPRKMNWTHIY